VTTGNNQAETPRHSVSVAGVIQDELGRVLLIKRADSGQWEIPGGILGLDEELHEGLVREVREETGIKVVPGSLTGVYKNMSLGIVALVFRCTPDGGDLARTDESTEVAWIDRSRLVALVGDRIRMRIEDALATLHSPTVRDHSHQARTAS
jgi:8-oxo-dGTP diphosphatase